MLLLLLLNQLILASLVVEDIAVLRLLVLKQVLLLLVERKLTQEQVVQRVVELVVVRGKHVHVHVRKQVHLRVGLVPSATCLLGLLGPRLPASAVGLLQLLQNEFLVLLLVQRQVQDVKLVLLLGHLLLPHLRLHVHGLLTGGHAYSRRSCALWLDLLRLLGLHYLLEQIRLGSQPWLSGGHSCSNVRETGWVHCRQTVEER